MAGLSHSAAWHPRLHKSHDPLQLSGLKAMWAPAAQIGLHSRSSSGAAARTMPLSSSTFLTRDDNDRLSLT